METLPPAEQDYTQGPWSGKGYSELLHCLQKPTACPRWETGASPVPFTCPHPPHSFPVTSPDSGRWQPKAPWQADKGQGLGLNDRPDSSSALGESLLGLPLPPVSGKAPAPDAVIAGHLSSLLLRVAPWSRGILIPSCSQWPCFSDCHAKVT